MGVNATAGSNFSFVWNGKGGGYSVSGKERERTFNVNPKDGLAGFYVGTSSLADVIGGC